MKRLSIEEWKQRNNPFKKVSKPKKAKAKPKYKPRNKSVLKSKVKPIKDIGVINAAKELAKIVSKDFD